ncbi:hypothetical protein [Lysinibacillus xylanilyticus]|uniref:BppU N-terminal domain-containing protein n=1 Tax=Lysinibacillus xylanilyticus TaxID=582475 RepID=A0ABT4EP26_9BACI|nr:hypothetical protein [Lysinibacillus xylanilyticus]MCY9547283.1 hypothetical protein [Lysinibacillus xylanilyticus]
MAITSGFHNSVNGDRKYNAEFFALFFGTLIANGVFPNPSTGLQVTANSNMTTSVKAGKGWINGYFIVNDGDYVLKHDNADGVLKRIDRVVMKLNHVKREIEVLIKKGTFASSPVAPALQRDADAYELALADVLIANGATQITQANITDQRLDKTVCGIVHGTVDQVDTTTIFNQYQAWFKEITGSTAIEIKAWQTQQKQEFDEWFATIQGILEGDVAANLAAKIVDLERKVDSKFMETDKAITAVDTALKTHTKDDSGHVRFIGNATGSDGMNCRTDLAPVDLVNGKLVPRKGHAFRFYKVDTTNQGPCTFSIVSDTLPGNPGSAMYQILNGRGKALKGGELAKDSIITLAFNGSAFILQGEGGGYYQGDIIKAQDLVNRKYLATNSIDPVDINDSSKASSFLHSEIATVNGVEYAFAWSFTYDVGSKFHCWEVLTGKLLWAVSPSSGYSYHTRIIVYNDKLYVGVFGKDDTVGLNGYGLEILNPINGARIALVGGTVPSSYADRAADICLWDNGSTKEVLLLTSNYNNGYVWIARFNPNSGSFLGVSSNLGGNHTDGIPHKMQTVGDYIFLASSKSMYQHKGSSFNYTGKVPFTYEYQLLGLAANNAGGISVIHVYGVVYVYSTSLALLSSIGVTGNEGSGLSIKGDLMCYATKTSVHMYRLASDAKTASFIETIFAPCNVSNITTIENVGFSENAVIPPLYGTKSVAQVLSKTLKIQR